MKYYYLHRLVYWYKIKIGGIQEIVPYKKIANIILLILISYPCHVSSSQESTIKIAMFGDSLIQGYGLISEEGFVSQLERALLSKGLKVRLVNLGVSGDTTSSGSERFDWSVSQDFDGLVLLLGANDMLRATPPNITYNNLRKILNSARTKRLPTFLIGIEATKNYGTEYKVKFDEIFSKLATEFQVPFYRNFFHILLKNRSPEEVLADMQEDRIHPNKNGVGKIVKDISPSVITFLKALKSN